AAPGPSPGHRHADPLAPILAHHLASTRRAASPAMRNRVPAAPPARPARPGRPRASRLGRTIRAKVGAVSACSARHLARRPSRADSGRAAQPVLGWPFAAEGGPCAPAGAASPRATTARSLSTCERTSSVTYLDSVIFFTAATTLALRTK